MLISYRFALYFKFRFRHLRFTKCKIIPVILVIIPVILITIIITLQLLSKGICGSQHPEGNSFFFSAPFSSMLNKPCDDYMRRLKWPGKLALAFLRLFFHSFLFLGRIKMEICWYGQSSRWRRGAGWEEPERGKRSTLGRRKRKH